MEYSSDETGSNGEEESQIRHFLRNDSEEAELTELIQAFPEESPKKSQGQQENFKKEQELQQEEGFYKHKDDEERLRREHQEDKLRREQHKDDEKLRREQQHEEERLCRKHLEEKLRRDQQDEERLRKERQQEVRLWQGQQQDKLHMDHQETFQWKCQEEEEERPKHDQQRCHLVQREDSYLKESQKHLHNNEESEIFNIVRHINDDIEEVHDISQTLPVMLPKWGSPVMPPPSPSRPKSPWGKLDPYDSCEEDRDYVGFATLPNQVHRKYVKKGFEFTLMVAGESGLGKSTLINSLFLMDLYRDRQLPCPEECVTQTVEIVKQTVDIQEKGVRLRLTVVDTPGYGDAVNNENCWKPIADYIDQQFEQYFRDESGLNRKNLQDTRVHCCLYFLSPLGHGMRPLDIDFLRALQDRVNIVPILGKADSLTTAELLQKKQRIRDELDHYGIRIYQFPDCDSDQDEEFKIQDMELKKSIPFAVIGSNTVVEVNGRRVRGRIYPWGVVEVENEQHCDFVKLRTMLIRTHMQDLKDVTRETHYENYRAQCIQSLTQRVVRERNRNKLTRESGTDFPIPSVPPSPDHETQRLIREKDEELRRMQEVLQKMQRQMKDSR